MCRQHIHLYDDDAAAVLIPACTWRASRAGPCWRRHTLRSTFQSSGSAEEVIFCICINLQVFWLLLGSRNIGKISNSRIFRSIRRAIILCYSLRQSFEVLFVLSSSASRFKMNGQQRKERIMGKNKIIPAPSFSFSILNFWQVNCPMWKNIKTIFGKIFFWKYD